jgi:hypothetical protein
MLPSRTAKHCCSTWFDVLRISKGLVLADFNGEMWIDPLFWKDLAEASQNRNAVDFFKKMAVIVEHEKLFGRFGVQYYN